MIKEISLAPFWRDLRRYSLSSFRGDLLAALTVALTALPQAMAYAFVAGLPPSAGIFSAIFGAIFTAGFGCSRYVVSGTTLTIAILIQSGAADILRIYYDGYAGIGRDVLALQVVLQISLVVGVFQILGGLLGLGRVTQFASRSVVMGYTTGLALAIVISQLYAFLGIQSFGAQLPLYEKGWQLVRHLHLLHWPTMLIGVGCLALLIVFRRKSQRIPAAAIVFILAALVTAYLRSGSAGSTAFDVQAGEPVETVAMLADAGPLTLQQPTIKLPGIHLPVLINIIPLAFAITLLSVLEITSIGRGYASAKDPPYSDNQEVYGLGVSNFLCSFLGSMPNSGSFSRSALNKAGGAKTRFAAMISGVFVYVFVLLLSDYVGKIPLAALSALMIFTAYSMINFKHLLICLRATRIDAFVVIATIGASLVFPLDVALYVGVVLSVVLYLKQAAVPDLVEYTFNNQGKLRQMEAEDVRPDSRICIIQPEGELFFGAADPFQTKLRQVAEDEDLKVVILQMINARHVDATICLALKQLATYLQKTGRHLLIASVTPDVLHVMREAGLMDKLSSQRIFPANEQVPSAPTRSAYAFAKELLEKS